MQQGFEILLGGSDPKRAPERQVLALKNNDEKWLISPCICVCVYFKESQLNFVYLTPAKCVLCFCFSVSSSDNARNSVNKGLCSAGLC